MNRKIDDSIKQRISEKLEKPGSKDSNGSIELSEFIKMIVADFRAANDRTDEKSIQELFDNFNDTEDGKVPETVTIYLAGEAYEIPKYLFRLPEILAPDEVEFEVETDIALQGGKIVTSVKDGLHANSPHIKIKMSLNNVEPSEIYSRIADKLLSDAFKTKG